MRIKHWLHELRLFLGIERSTTSHGEKLISGLGAFLGIVAVYWGTRWCFPDGFMHTAGTLLMVTSMGAS
ncbi:MAG TPA: HPP domain-containing protein, partial [Cellvibrio sp.]